MNKKLLFLIALIVPFGVITGLLMTLIEKFYSSFFVQRFIFMDNKFKYFVYSEFDSPATSEDIADGLETYSKNYKKYLKGSGKANMHDEFIERLDLARDEVEGLGLGLVFLINSGYRTPQYNAELDGAVANSAHIYGLASDIAIGEYSDEEKELILNILRKYFVRIGKSNDFYHVDIDDSKPQVEWTY